MVGISVPQVRGDRRSPPSDSPISGNIRENSPFYLHPSENPASVLVTPPLDNTNYHSWSKYMQRALRSKKKWQLVDGSIVPPEFGDEDYFEWESCNSMIISWLMASVEPSIAQSLNGLETAAEVWKDLKEHFGTGDSIKIARLQMQLCTLKQGGLSVTEYFTIFRNIWDQFVQYRPIDLCKCVDKEKGSSDCDSVKSNRLYLQQDQVIKFLIGLNENYDTIRSQLMLVDPLPTITRTLYLALQHEQQLLGSGSSSIVANSATSVNFVKRQDTGSTARPYTDQRKSSWNNKKRATCTYCGKEGHTVDKCYRKHGFPPNFKFTNRAGNGNSQPFAGSAHVSDSFDDNNAGYLVKSAGHSSSGGLHQLNQGLDRLGLSADQYNNLLALVQQSSNAPMSSVLSHHVVHDAQPQVNAIHRTPLSGPHQFEGDW